MNTNSKFFSGLAAAVCIFFLTGAPAAFAQTETYALSDLYQAALKSAQQIRIAKNQLFIAEKDQNRAFSVLLPQLSAFGDYIRYSESSLIQPETNYDYGIKLQQQFTLNGKELILLRAAKDTIKQRRYDLDSVKESYLYQVAVAYYEVVNRKKQVEILRENVKRLTAYRDAVRIKLKLEEVPKTDLLRTEAELSGAAAELIRAENEWVYARSALARMVNISPDFSLSPPETRVNAQMPIQGRLDEFVDIALKSRADMKSAEMSVSLADDDISISKGDYWPVVGIEAGYLAQETDPSVLSQDSIYGAANINLILFDWGLRKGTVSQNRARKRIASLQADELAKQIALEVERAWLALNTAQNTITALQDKLVFSRAAYEAVTLQFKLGQADSLDVLDANTTLRNAERELTEAEFVLSLSKIALQRAQGIFLDQITAGDMSRGCAPEKSDDAAQRGGALSRNLIKNSF